MLSNDAKHSHTSDCHRSGQSDPEDLWDFGTVRHVSKPGTIGRTNNSVKVSGPPLTWEVNGSTRQEMSQSSISTKRTANTLTKHADLPRLPPVDPASARGSAQDKHATVRRMPSGSLNNHQKDPQAQPKGKSSNQNEDEDNCGQTFPRGTNVVQDKCGDDEDDLPDTTMLDSVILPAIASVSCIPIYGMLKEKCASCSYFPAYRRRKPELLSVRYNAHLRKQSALYQV